MLASRQVAVQSPQPMETRLSHIDRQPKGMPLKPLLSKNLLRVVILYFLYWEKTISFWSESPSAPRWMPLPNTRWISALCGTRRPSSIASSLLSLFLSASIRECTKSASPWSIYWSMLAVASRSVRTSSRPSLLKLRHSRCRKAKTRISFRSRLSRQ